MLYFIARIGKTSHYIARYYSSFVLNNAELSDIMHNKINMLKNIFSINFWCHCCLTQWDPLWWNTHTHIHMLIDILKICNPLSLLLYTPKEQLASQHFYIIRSPQSQGHSCQIKKIGGLLRKILLNQKADVSLYVTHWWNTLNLSACIF